MQAKNIDPGQPAWSTLADLGSKLCRMNDQSENILEHKSEDSSFRFSRGRTSLEMLRMTTPSSMAASRFKYNT